MPRLLAKLGGLGALLAVVALIVGIIAAIIAIAWGISRQSGRQEKPKPQEPFVSSLYNFRIQVPPQWRADPVAERAIDAIFLLKRDDPPVWVALAARDMKTRTIPPGEMQEEGLRRVTGYFKAVASEPAPDAMFAGQPAKRFVFQGERNDSMMSGDCLMLQHQGYAYWVIAWCPTDKVNEAQPEIDALREQFQFSNQRPDWKPAVRKFTGKKAVYELAEEGQRWQIAGSAASDYDPLADLVLEARESANDPPGRRAMIFVLIFPAAADPVAAAREHLLNQQKEVYPETTIRDADPQPSDAPKVRVGARPGSILTLEMSNTTERQRFVVLAVMPRPEGAIAIQCECDGARRGSWEAEFRRVIASFR